MRLVALALACSLVGGVAVAEEDFMEVQRCVWRCLAESKGADDRAYGRCTERRCSGKPEKPRNQRAKPQRRSETGAPGRWLYGEHRVLGLSAHVEVGDEAFGLSCPAPRANGEPHGYAVVTRFTRGLSPSKDMPENITFLWKDPFEVGGNAVYKLNDSILMSEDDYCGSYLPRLKKHGGLLLLREPFESLSFADGRSKLTVRRADGPIEIEGVKDIARLESPIDVPLAGASRAIAQLAKDCPALRRQMTDDCAVD